MITGFNTDIEHNGVVYHVQTEDKGLDTPIILSLVYVGGAILASKRAPYEDLIAEGFSDEVLSERLKRQHRLICAAINSGRINDLKRMSRVAEEQAASPIEPAEIPQKVQLVTEPEIILEEATEPEIIREEAEETERVAQDEVSDVGAFELELEDIPSQIWAPPPPKEELPDPAVTEDVIEAAPEEEVGAYTDLDSHGQIKIRDVAEQGLQILLLNDAEFSSGEVRTLRVLVVDRKGDHEKALYNVAVSIKILGTTFRPLIYSIKTDKEGVASVTTQIPHFTSGRAAVLVRAAVRDHAAELRRVIHPTK